MGKDKVCVVIPIYTNNLKVEERCALRHNITLLSAYPIMFVYPKGFNILPLHQAYPHVGLQPVSDKWLGEGLGIFGYNKMMVSESFYKLFVDYEYILICHTDAWIFHDELTGWCNKGYDLVAAPWPMPPRYKHFPIRQYMLLRLKLKSKHKYSHYQKYGRIGNGGLCLRRVETFRKACITYKADIERYANKINEDVFWALHSNYFNVPSVEEAMKFSFDKKPKLLYELNHSQLPMGCHDFNNPTHWIFWQQFINLPLS